MSFDFDTPLSLNHIHSDKWDNVPAVFGISGDDVLPMWVADMDFAAAPPIVEAMQAEVTRRYFGYWGHDRPVAEAAAGWLDRTHGWSVDPDAMRFTHGVVLGFATTLSAFTDPGDAVILFSPVYHTFFRRARAMGREVLESPLQLVNGRFEMDLDTLQSALTGREKMLVLCNPHNPGGRIWTAQEVRAVAEFCGRNDLLLISDEIHMDLTFPRFTHLPTAAIAPGAMDRLIVLTAASKGFNIAGGETGLVIIPDADLRARYDVAHRAQGGTPNRFGMIMMKAAFTHGDAWSAAVRSYLADNFTLWRDAVSALPGISVMDMDATYLTWVDFAGTGMDEAEVKRRLLEDARIAASAGRPFGLGGETCSRFNIAMPRPLLREAIGRMNHAFADLQ